VAIAICGFIVGYFFFDASSEVRSLHTQLANARSEISKLQRSQSRGPTQHPRLPRLESRTPSEGPSGTNEAPPRITKEDLEIALAMNDRAKAGEYILEFERPVDRKLMEDGIKAFAAQMASNNAPALREQFSKLGVDDQKAQLLEKHAEKIMWASLEAEQAIRQVLSARSEYDKRVRSVLSDEGYKQYRDYEDSQAALREHRAITAYAEQTGFRTDSAYDDHVVAVLQQLDAYTQISWHGPYDGLPQTIVGREMVASHRSNEINNLSQAATQIRNVAAQAALPEALVNLLESYYAEVIQQKQDSLERLKNPPPPPVSFRR
jgi:hypothetical protein